DAIGKAIKKCCHEWVINKVFTITVDNASFIDMPYLKKKFAHIRTSIPRGQNRVNRVNVATLRNGCCNIKGKLLQCLSDGI
ncbi:hypothetical protein J1N35_043635, partial [Gossypium stocksii]